MPESAQFRLVVEETGSDSHLRVIGDFDLAAVGRVEDALDSVFEAPAPKRVVFDLRGLTFLDGAGLRAILRASERARAEAVRLLVVRPQGHASRVFTLTRAWQWLNLVDRPGGRGVR
jgi:anti-anti-sigma factor